MFVQQSNPLPERDDIVLFTIFLGLLLHTQNSVFTRSALRTFSNFLSRRFPSTVLPEKWFCPSIIDYLRLELICQFCKRSLLSRTFICKLPSRRHLSDIHLNSPRSRIRCSQEYDQLIFTNYIFRSTFCFSIFLLSFSIAPPCHRKLSTDFLFTFFDIVVVNSDSPPI